MSVASEANRPVYKPFLIDGKRRDIHISDCMEYDKLFYFEDFYENATRAEQSQIRSAYTGTYFRLMKQYSCEWLHDAEELFEKDFKKAIIKCHEVIKSKNQWH